jgi:hypothetical protein
MNPEMAGDGDIQITRCQNRNFALGEGFHQMNQKPHTWTLFLRYQAQAERQYRRAIEEFERLRALRPELEEEQIEEIPNEPNLAPQPESNQPDPIPETNPIPDVGQTPRSARVPLDPPLGATEPSPHAPAGTA